MSKPRICLLPKEGIENPYQKLMKDGLKEGGFDVRYGTKTRFFDILLTWITQRPQWIHIDWPYSFYSINLPTPFKWLFYYCFQIQVTFISRFTKCKIAQTLHNIHRHEPYHKEIDHKAQLILFRHAEFIRVFHQGTIEKVKASWKIDTDKFIIQPEGSYVGYYPNQVSKSDARTELGFDLQDFILLYLGSIRPYKGILDLIDNFKTYRKDNWKLIIAGYPYDRNYTDLVKNRCENLSEISLYLGHQPEERLQYYFNASDVVASPFRQIENSGSVILAMGFQRPVIAPKMGVLIERLKSQPELLYETSITDSFEFIHSSDPHQLEKMGRRNFEELKKHTWQHFAKLFR